MIKVQGNRRRGGAVLMSGALMSGFLLTGCGGGLLSGGDEKSDDGPIVLGMLIPLSGTNAAIGPYMQNAAELAVDEINADGGVDGRDLELKVEDEACDAKEATAGANKLVSEGVDISIGGYCSSATLPTLPIFEKADVPMIIPAANSNELVDQRKPNVFMINGTGAQQADAAVQFMRKEGATRVGIMDDNTSYSKDIANRTAEQLTGEPDLVGRESVTAGESDYSANVNAMLGKNPDWIYWTGYYQEGGLIVRQLRQAGYDGAIMVADGSVDQKLVDIAEAHNAEGVFATMTQTPQTIPGAKAKQWIEDYRAKYGDDPGPYSTQSYDAVRVAAEAVREAGSTDAEAVIEALESIDGFELFSGPLQFTDDHTLSSGGFQILQVQDGKFALKDALR